MTAVPAPNARPRRPLSRRRRLLFALVPVFALLLLAELGIRLVRAPLHFGSFRALRTDLMKRNYPAELDATLGYVPRPGFASRDNHWATQVSIDADGMRKNGGPTPPGDTVIACVGDSFTFGDEVDDDASWPARLEVAMQKPVKNGGVFGYSLTQAVLRAEAMLQRFRVDTLVVAFIPDDLVRSEFEKRYTKLPWFEFVGDGIELRGVPIVHDAGAGDATKRWKDAFGCSALVDAVLANTLRAWWFENEKQIMQPSLQGRHQELGKKLLERIDARCRAQNVRLLVVLLGEDPFPYALEVLQHAERKGMQVLDLASRYRAMLADDAELRTKWFRGHMTRDGNEWAAQQIAAVLRTKR